jgi:D-glycero-alpha-D-manno-heptose-7-phosphate kinase
MKYCEVVAEGMKLDKRLIRSRAPLRISYAGGGTDVSPYCDEHGGAVLSSTIDCYAYCTIKPRWDDSFTIRSLDFNKQEHWVADPTMLSYDGNLDLVKAVIKHFDIEQGFDMFLHCDAPPGSGLGSSSTVMVALIGAVAEWQGEPLSLYDLARLAYSLERKELGFAGGRQDQYAAAFGGFNFIEFRGDDVVVTPLRVRDDILNELHYLTLLCNTGRTRDSADIIKKQSKNMSDGKPQVIAALDDAKRLATEQREALVKGDIHRMGELLDASWEAKKKFTSAISNERIDAIYNAAKENGAIGGKISGAGGGGFMYFICEYYSKHDVAEALSALGVEIRHFNFEKNGMQTWRYLG